MRRTPVRTCCPPCPWGRTLRPLGPRGGPHGTGSSPTANASSSGPASSFSAHSSWTSTCPFTRGFRLRLRHSSAAALGVGAPEIGSDVGGPRARVGGGHEDSSMQRVGRPSPSSPSANPRATERLLSAWTTRRCRAGAALGSAGLAAAQQAGVRHSHVRSETRDPFPCTLTKEPGALGRSSHPAPSPHLGAPGGASRCDLEGEGRPPSQEPSTRTPRREQRGVHGGPESSGGNSEALPPP